MFTIAVLLDSHQCDNPPPITNGSVFYGKTTAMSVATYQCHKGLRLVGVPERTCTTNGIWSGEKPACVLSCK